MDKKLSDVLQEHISLKEDGLICGEIEIKKLSYLQLRDAIWKIGCIVAELEDDHIYIASIKSGKMKKNTAYLAIELMPGKLEIVGYAKEGLLHQNTVDKAIQQLKDVLDNKSSERDKMSDEDMKKKKCRKQIGLSIVLVMFIGLSVLYVQLIFPAVSATHKYNEAVDAYNEMSGQYDVFLESVSVDNIDGISASAGQLERESEEIFDVVRTIFSGNTTNKINHDTATIYKLIKSMENDLKVVAQISNPSSNWVIERLENVSKIKEIEAVSENNDPGQMLGKDGGYTSCVYFTISDIDSDSVEGDSVLEKGTDGGGAIEVFSSSEDAEARCEYLSGFDNTLMYSGSYAVVGTMVIRISYRLDGESQFNLTDDITRAFTTL